MCYVSSVMREASRFADEAWEAGRCLNSFSGDTPVDTADGPRPIQTIAVGDPVWAWDAQTDTTGVYTVTDIIHHQDAATLWLNLDGERIETTPEHPFFVLLRGWIDAKDLHVGDWVRQRAGDDRQAVDRASATAPQPYRLLFTMLRETGMRAGEVVARSLGDVSLAAGREGIRVRDPKNRTERIVILGPTATPKSLRLLRSHLKTLGYQPAHVPLVRSPRGTRAIPSSA